MRPTDVQKELGHNMSNEGFLTQNFQNLVLDALSAIKVVTGNLWSTLSTSGNFSELNDQV